jgi:hypothetical protein
MQQVMSAGLQSSSKFPFITVLVVRTEIYAFFVVHHIFPKNCLALNRHNLLLSFYIERVKPFQFVETQLLDLKFILQEHFSNCGIKANLMHG